MLFKLRYLKEHVRNCYNQASHPRKLDYAVVTGLIPATELHSHCTNPKTPCRLSRLWVNRMSQNHQVLDSALVTANQTLSALQRCCVLLWYTLNLRILVRAVRKPTHVLMIFFWHRTAASTSVCRPRLCVQVAKQFSRPPSSFPYQEMSTSSWLRRPNSLYLRVFASACASCPVRTLSSIQLC
jgi:hypothetical protein